MIKAILTEAGVKAARELPLKIMKRVSEQFKEVTFALFDDVLSTLRALKQQDLILGLLTNLAGDVVTICRKLGLEPYLNFVVTAEETGADKPNPLYF